MPSDESIWLTVTVELPTDPIAKRSLAENREGYIDAMAALAAQRVRNWFREKGVRVTAQASFRSTTKTVKL